MEKVMSCEALPHCCLFLGQKTPSGSLCLVPWQLTWNMSTKPHLTFLLGSPGSDVNVQKKKIGCHFVLSHNHPIF